MSPAKETESRSERITVAVTPTLYKLLESYAEAHGQSMSAALGDVLEDASSFLAHLTKLRVAVNERKRRMWERAKGTKGAT
jgi:DNA-binding transcriptional MocR family regulator